MVHGAAMTGTQGHRSPLRRLKSLGIVVPFYNEAAGVQAFYQRLRSAVDALDVSCAFVFVDDGSRDETLTLLNGLADVDPCITVLSLSRNWGHQMALTAGLDHVGEDVDAVVTMDGDLQHPPEAIVKMVRLYESGADGVYAVRRENTGAGPMKQLVSRAFNALLGWSTDVNVVAGAADFRLMSRETVGIVRQMREVHRYPAGMVPWAGFSSAVIVYDQEERHAGTPGYTWRRSLRLAQHGVFSFSVLPLHVITWLGVFFAAIAALYLSYVAWVSVQRAGRNRLAVCHRCPADRQRVSIRRPQHSCPVCGHGLRAGETAASLRAETGPFGPEGRPAFITGGGRHQWSLPFLIPASEGDPHVASTSSRGGAAKLAGALTAEGRPVSATTVGKLLDGLGYRLHALQKAREGAAHPDRNAQFEHINATAATFIQRGQPVISVDTKKKELVGDFTRTGQE